MNGYFRSATLSRRSSEASTGSFDIKAGFSLFSVLFSVPLTLAACSDLQTRTADKSRTSFSTEHKANDSKPAGPGERVSPSTQLAETHMVDIDEVSTQEALRQLLDRKKPALDLSVLYAYSKPVTRAILLPLTGKDARIVTKLRLSSLPVTDNDIEPISGLKLVSLELDRTKVIDLHALKGMNGLQILSLEDTQISDKGIKQVSQLENLRELNLNQTPVHYSDLKSLAHLPHLNTLHLSGCNNITESDLQNLRKQLRCDIPYTRNTKQLESGFSKLRDISKSILYDGEYAEADLAVQKLINDWSKDLKPCYEWIAEGYSVRAECQKREKNYDARYRLLQKAWQYTSNICQTINQCVRC